MSTDRYRGYKFRYVHDSESKGKVKVYVEKGANSGTKHIYKGTKGSPDHICFKKNCKPSSYSKARKMARDWADMNRG